MILKMLKRRWYGISNEEKELTTIRIGDIRFTIFKKSALKFNKRFPIQLRWTDKQFKMREQIRKRKYKPRGKHPNITKDNVCVDGHHRLAALLEYYGEDYEITVGKSKYTYGYIFWLAILSFPLIKTIYRNDKDLNG